MKLQKIFTVCALCLLLTLLAGCTFLDGLKLFKSGDEQEPSEQDQVVLEQDLDVTGTDGAEDDMTAQDDQSMDQDTQAASAPAEGSRRVVLYFASQNGDGLESESRDIPKQDGIAKATVNELIAGPQSSTLNPTLPSSAIVEGMDVSNGLCTVDFSSELVDHLSADPQAQLLAVYSIVNTLTQFDSVDRVRILVDGETVSGGLGGVDLTAALAPVSL